MTHTPNDKVLLALAERCEKATGSNKSVTASIFDDAFDACFPKPSRIWVTDNSGPWTEEYAAFHERGWRYAKFLDAGAHLDAAMTLVPEGCDRLVFDAEGGRWVCILGVPCAPTPASRQFAYGEGVTKELALCAAALRARANQEQPQ